MRLKSYTAASMAEAMALVRHELGDDAIIVSTQRAPGGKGVRITAALEQSDAEDAISEILASDDEALAEAVRGALLQHGTPGRLVERLANAARTADVADPTKACAFALEAGFTFAPLPDQHSPRPFLLIGPPGGGKTMSIAKLAARSAIKQRHVGVITCDSLRAGAIHQLAAFTRILGIDLRTAKGPEGLRRCLDAAEEEFDIVFIDSPSLNPFKPADMEYVTQLCEAADVEPILVLAAGGDPTEASEIGEAFGQAGATRLFATRLDTTRRLGAVLAAADAAQLNFCDVSVGPHVANGIAPLTAGGLSRLILPPKDSHTTTHQKTEAHA